MKNYHKIRTVIILDNEAMIEKGTQRPFTGNGLYLNWVAGALSAFLFFKVHNHMPYMPLYLGYFITEINLSHFHLTLGNEILYWYCLTSNT